MSVRREAAGKDGAEERGGEERAAKGVRKKGTDCFRKKE